MGAWQRLEESALAPCALAPIDRPMTTARKSDPHQRLSLARRAAFLLVRQFDWADLLTGKRLSRGAYFADGAREIRIPAEMPHVRPNRSCRYVGRQISWRRLRYEGRVRHQRV